MRKIISILLTACMLFAIAACGEGGKEGSSGNKSGAPRKIVIGTWYEIYYVSKHTDIYDNPTVTDPFTAEMRLAKMREIEEKHNIELDFFNLTWSGIQESIITSIMAGSPDCDIYITDTQFGIPAALNGLAISLEEMNLQDTDVFNEQKVMRYLNLGQEQSYLFNTSVLSEVRTYVLAFNMDMIKAKNLENPQDLWDRGEWTWDKWREYLKALTDLDNNIYGWSGYWTNMLSHMLFANGTTIASGPKTTITSPATIQVLDFFFTIYNTDRTARPWEEGNWEINNNMYADGRSAFWIGADWLFGEQGGAELPFEIGVVPWPTGPSGSNNRLHGGVGGNWYMIPKGTDNPRQVYDVIYDWLNWFDYERELAEDLEWSQNQYMTERNFGYALMMAQNTGLDLWNDIGLGDDFSMIDIMNGEKTAAQYAAEVELLIQDALNGFFG